MFTNIVINRQGLQFTGQQVKHLRLSSQAPSLLPVYDSMLKLHIHGGIEKQFGTRLLDL